MIEMVAWVNGYESTQHTEFAAVNRFVRWGIVHGPIWGIAAAIIFLPLSSIIGIEISPLPALGGGLVLGLAGGPILGGIVGLICVAADRAPEWLLDAPDYVAVLTITGVLAAIAWPVLDLGRAGPAAAALAFMLLVAVPVADAAQHAPQLLHPDRESSTSGLAKNAAG